MSIIGAAYIRVSTDDQLEFSPDSQLKRIREYADSHDIRIPDEYVFTDEGISGRSADKRPAFQEMIALARSAPNSPPFLKILVWKFSRFARSRQDSIFYKSMLRKSCGIEVISITEPLSHDPTSILIEALLEAMDEYYSINLSQEVRRGMQERFSRGRAISIPPFGYCMGKEALEIHPEQGKWVRYMYQAYANGLSLNEIASSLQQSHVYTNRGNLFDSRAVAYILHNPVYIGRLRKRDSAAGHSSGDDCHIRSRYDRYYEGTDVLYADGLHLPLISDSLWQQVQQRLHSREPAAGKLTSGQLPSSSETSASSYYLQGLVQCGSCKCPLVHVRQDSAFQCSGYNHGKCHCSHFIQRQNLEALICDALLSASSELHFCYPAVLTSPAASAETKNRLLKQLGIRFRYDKPPETPTDSITVILVTPDSL